MTEVKEKNSEIEQLKQQLSVFENQAGKKISWGFVKRFKVSSPTLIFKQGGEMMAARITEEEKDQIKNLGDAIYLQNWETL